MVGFLSTLRRSEKGLMTPSLDAVLFADEMNSGSASSRAHYVRAYRSE